MSHQLSRRLRAAACLAAGTSACHEFAPRTELSALPAGGALHVVLNDAGSTAVAPTLGPRVAEVDGRIVARGDSSLTLAVAEVLRADGSGQSFAGDRVVLAWSAVRRAGVPRTSVGRSLAIGAGITLAAVLVARGLGRGNGVQGTRGGGAEAPR